jgi:hypothetical protein
MVRYPNFSRKHRAVNHGSVDVHWCFDRQSEDESKTTEIAVVTRAMSSVDSRGRTLSIPEYPSKLDKLVLASSGKQCSDGLACVPACWTPRRTERGSIKNVPAIFLASLVPAPPFPTQCCSKQRTTALFVAQQANTVGRHGAPRYNCPLKLRAHRF